MLIAWPREGVSNDEERWGAEAVQKAGRLLQAEESLEDSEGPFLGTYIPEELPGRRESSKRNGSSTSLLLVETAVVPQIMLKTEEVARESHALLSSRSDRSDQEMVQDPLPLSNSASLNSILSKDLRSNVQKLAEESPDGLALGHKGSSALETKNKQTAPRAKMMMVTGVDSATCSTERGMEIGMKGLQNKMDYAR